MKKKKIAESIIIRVGGGIREVRREPCDISDTIESDEKKPDLDKCEDMHSFQPGFSTSTGKSKDELII